MNTRLYVHDKGSKKRHGRNWFQQGRKNTTRSFDHVLCVNFRVMFLRSLAFACRDWRGTWKCFCWCIFFPAAFLSADIGINLGSGHAGWSMQSVPGFESIFQHWQYWICRKQFSRNQIRTQHISILNVKVLMVRQLCNLLVVVVVAQLSRIVFARCWRQNGFRTNPAWTCFQNGLFGYLCRVSASCIWHVLNARQVSLQDRSFTRGECAKNLIELFLQLGMPNAFDWRFWTFKWHPCWHKHWEQTGYWHPQWAPKQNLNLIISWWNICVNIFLFGMLNLQSCHHFPLHGKIE